MCAQYITLTFYSKRLTHTHTHTHTQCTHAHSLMHTTHTRTHTHTVSSTYTAFAWALVRGSFYGYWQGGSGSPGPIPTPHYDTGPLLLLLLWCMVPHRLLLAILFIGEDSKDPVSSSYPIYWGRLWGSSVLLAISKLLLCQHKSGGIYLSASYLSLLSISLCSTWLWITCGLLLYAASGQLAYNLEL